MRRIVLFVEDFGHETFLKALVWRLAAQHQLSIIGPETFSARGGRGAVLNELGRFAHDLKRGLIRLPDLLLVAIDGNCKGHLQRRQEIEHKTDGVGVPMICAVPDPHLERWLLIDSGAFKKVFGKGCQAPDQKCERDRYKKLLLNAICDAGRTPLIGGLEHTEDIVNAMDLANLKMVDDSFGKLLKALDAQFKEWKQE